MFPFYPIFSSASFIAREFVVLTGNTTLFQSLNIFPPILFCISDNQLMIFIKNTKSVEGLVKWIFTAWFITVF